MELPLVTAALDAKPHISRRQAFPSQRERFLAAVAIVEAALAAGQIANPVFVEAKLTINRGFETAWDQISVRHINGRFMSLPEQVREFSHQFSTPQLHTVAGYLKRATKSVIDHPVYDEVVALLREIAPLAETFATLKTMVVKRERKPAEEVIEGYQPPPVSSEAQKQVVALLEAVTTSAYDRLKAMLIESYGHLLDGYLAAQRSAPKALSPYDHFMGRHTSFPNPAAYHIIDRVVANDHGRGPYHALPQAEVAAIFLADATKLADEYRTFFIHKNYRKIASIIDAKGNYANGYVIGHSVNLSGLTGTLAFSFTDGSSFRVQNNVVDVLNSHGTRFLRYPLTFHKVVLPTGKRLMQPSQERMNTIFAKVEE